MSQQQIHGATYVGDESSTLHYDQSRDALIECAPCGAVFSCRLLRKIRDHQATGLYWSANPTTNLICESATDGIRTLLDQERAGE